MKKLITISALTFSLVFLFSCTKDSQSLNSSAAKQVGSATGNPDGRMVPPSAPHPDVAGDWISLKYEELTDGTYSGLHGNYLFTNPLDASYNLDRKLVFIRIPVDPSPDPGTVTYTYRALPTDMMTSIGKVHMACYLTSSSMDIGIASIDSTTMPNIDDFGSIAYRYFFLTKSTYLSNNIDWTDYNAVITVFNTVP